MRNENAVVATVFHAAAEIAWIRPCCLHPFGGNDDSRCFGKLCAAEVSKPCAAHRHGDLLCISNDTEVLCIDFRDEERCAMAEDMVVEACTTCVNKVKLTAKREPMLLCIVGAELRSVVEQPFDRFAEMKTVL